jgi:hypothetical protein
MPSRANCVWPAGPLRSTSPRRRLFSRLGPRDSGARQRPARMRPSPATRNAAPRAEETSIAPITAALALVGPVIAADRCSPPRIVLESANRRARCGCVASSPAALSSAAQLNSSAAAAQHRPYLAQAPANQHPPQATQQAGQHVPPSPRAPAPPGPARRPLHHAAAHAAALPDQSPGLEAARHAGGDGRCAGGPCRSRRRAPPCHPPTRTPPAMPCAQPISRHTSRTCCRASSGRGCQGP